MESPALTGPILYLLFAWGALTTVFIGLLIWRSLLVSHEDDQIFPINLPRKKTCSSEAWVSQDTMVVAENPGLKSGTWATHWVSF